jgi:preprotein translocase subunit SecF
MKLNVIGSSKIWFAISAVLVVASIVAVATLGLQYGIDFTGGSLIEVEAPGVSTETLDQELTAAGFDAVVQAGEGEGKFIRLANITEEQHQQILSTLQATHPELTETRFDSVGPVIGDELKKASITAVILLLTLIGLYVAWAFRRVSEPVASWKYGVVTLLAAVHDVIIPIGAFAVLGHFFGYQVDTAFVAAMLTILGYSINDTIVVFDRTRENLVRHRHSTKSFSEIVNQSVTETLGRSFNTTLTTLLPLIAIFVIGGPTTRPFVLALIIGIVSGAYSSIFFASPLLVLWDKWSRRSH